MKNELIRLLDQLQVKHRLNGTQYVCQARNVSELDGRIFREFHGTEFAPDDFRYNAIRDILISFVDQDIQNTATAESSRGDIVNAMVEVYTVDLVKWLSSDLKRLEYCDSAKVDNCSPNATMVEIMMMGQYLELDEIYGNIVEYFEAWEVRQEVERANL